jgi:hypothetical protein
MTISLAFDFAWNCKGGRSLGKQGRLLVAFSIYLRNALAFRANFFSCYGTKGGFER